MPEISIVFFGTGVKVVLQTFQITAVRDLLSLRIPWLSLIKKQKHGLNQSSASPFIHGTQSAVIHVRKIPFIANLHITETWSILFLNKDDKNNIIGWTKAHSKTGFSINDWKSSKALQRWSGFLDVLWYQILVNPFQSVYAYACLVCQSRALVIETIISKYTVQPWCFSIWLC